MHSVRIELTKLILVGTRITYQATGDTGIMDPFIMVLRNIVIGFFWSITGITGRGGKKSRRKLQA